MERKQLQKLLESLVTGNTSMDKVIEKLECLPYEDIGYARLDYHRQLRTGFPEVVFCQGKTVDQVAGIFTKLAAKTRPVLGTRAVPEVYAAVHKIFPEAQYFEMARCIVIPSADIREEKGNVIIISAGTADMPVAEEAAVTAETMGLKVIRLYDVGVAGIHRLLDHAKDLQKVNVVIAVAGMEGALASVVGGLTRRPVIAVPTSVGYGANFGGVAALLSMLNSCASGVGVVNIDNGYGAAALAHAIIESGRNDD
ncbi:MAG: 1-(5-phosphoribosyl)-5-amino-4-imidazole-carboxylate carboxylase [Gracilibacter sp. BRH_c7a]|nr:MAG: 1-(5-phosphoribosyl)-5-amino-4-imidazole-carboxylate carboxylase [Gracilibacter sp. BRH_c7a]